MFYISDTHGMFKHSRVPVISGLFLHLQRSKGRRAEGYMVRIGGILPIQDAFTATRANTTSVCRRY